MIEIENAAVIKSGVSLLKNFSWQINADEHWVISGPNGSGKTILLEIIAGIQHLVAGEIRYAFIEGGSWDERYAQRKKDIIFVPAQASESFYNLGAGMYYQQRYYTLGDEHTPLVREILGSGTTRLSELKIPDSLSINHLLDLEITRLSNGQLKKVLFIASLLKGIPRFLLLDYPFEGLDIASRKDLCDFIDFLVTTHSIQIILVDHRHRLPKCISHRLTLNNFAIHQQERVSNIEVPLPAIVDISHGTAGADDPVIQIEDLTIRYGQHTILTGFNWTVNKGERWALIGRNGAGKTTLFSMIFADHPMAYSQKISLFGTRRGTGESIWDIKRRIHYVGSELLSYLNPDHIMLSARDYILTANKKTDSRDLEKLVTYFQANNFFDKPVRSLSSGQLQLMMILNCFVTSKELFLLDEPFQYLDIPQRERVSTYLQTRMRQDTTLILITHDEGDLVHWAEKTRAL